MFSAYIATMILRAAYVDILTGVPAESITAEMLYRELESMQMEEHDSNQK